MRGRADDPSDAEPTSSGPSPQPEVLSAAAAVPSPAATPAPAAVVEEARLSRLDRWQARLLDLSRRNRLLNFRDSKRTVPLLSPGLAALEETIAAGTEFTILPRPPCCAPSPPESTPVAQPPLTGDPGDVSPPAAPSPAGGRENDVPAPTLETDTPLRRQLRQGRLYSPLAAPELERRLLEISRGERLSAEESGANALFLVLGFLRWYESGGGNVANLAPLILVPMRIERGSVRAGFRVSLLDEESRINVTLLRKLETDFGLNVRGLEPPQAGESGLDVDGILARFREAVRPESRWEIVEDAALAVLTFTKFLMWLDLECHTDQLRQNPVVSHLLDQPDQPFPIQTVALPAGESLDEVLGPEDTYCPLDADSSQIEAVLAAERGLSFVLQGPPGTGKSQTIANLIAHCATKGKRVLFVSEKMAALDVVRRRLAAVGLGPFCLELHSRTANKQDFRRQIEEVLQLGHYAVPGDWPRQTAQLARQRAELNAFVQALHRPRSFGASAYWALDRVIQHAALADVDLELGPFEALTPERFEGMVAVGQRLQTAAVIAGLRADHPLREVRLTDWRLGLDTAVRQAARRVLDSAAALAGPAAVVLPALGLGAGDWSRFTLEFGGDLADCLRDVPAVPRALVEAADWPETRLRLLTLIDRGRHRDTLRRRLFATYRPELGALPVAELHQRLRTRQHQNALAAWWRLARTRSTLQKLLLSPMSLTPERMEADLAAATDLVTVEREMAQSSDLTALLGGFWREGQPDWDLVQRQVDWLTRFRVVAARFSAEDPARQAALRSQWVERVTDRADELAPGGAMARELARFCQASEAFRKDWAELVGLLLIDAVGPLGEEQTPDFLALTREAAGRWTDGLDELRAWCAYQGARAEAAALGLEPLPVAVESGAAEIASLSALTEKSLARWCLSQLHRQEPLLGRFFGAEHNARIAAFGDLDRAVRDLTGRAVFAQLSLRLPTQGLDAERFRSSQVGTLQRFVRGGRFTIRRVFAECSDALARLKPCVLMSPLSVAQFLGTDFPRFDIVVFDEASQMPPWDAIGAIARGRQLIVVGDSRQLPPTTFFASAADEDDDRFSEDDLQDLESILDECVASQLPVLSLKWHYRSRHESLIAFSNGHYYQHQLLTFPAATGGTRDLGVSWCEVRNGCYDASRTRTNRAEAEAVVADVVARLSDATRRHQSVGVVTFSLAQQRLIEDLLEQARAAHPQIEPYFSDAVPEPVFVKNLETVQGDERDVILFSVCYGPNRDGVVNLNFGPLNNRGGERRLNVAITRARSQLRVYSTLRPEHIDLTRTDAVGVKHLKEFLAFAARAATPEAETTATGLQTAPPSRSALERAVQEWLAQSGWQVEARVGCSQYRVDLAVRHPEHPECFLLGVECDGASYRSAVTARDRDRLRQEVLGVLGWRLTRAWASDWWLSPARERDRLRAELEQARQAFVPPGSRPSAEGGNAIVVAGGSGVAEPDIDTSRPVAGLDPQPVRDLNRDGLPDLPGQALYQVAKLRRLTRSGPTEFFAAAATAAITSRIREVLAVEAPIHPELLVRRVAACWGIAKVDPDVVGRVLSVLPEADVRRERTPTREFLWRRDQDRDRYTGFRVPGPAEDSLRTPEQISPQEVANAMRQLLTEHSSLGPDDLLRSTAALFGCARAGGRTRVFFEEGLAQLSAQGPLSDPRAVSGEADHGPGGQ